MNEWMNIYFHLNNIISNQVLRGMFDTSYVKKIEANRKFCMLQIYRHRSKFSQNSLFRIYYGKSENVCAV
jgi:hypothetical protein